MVKTLYLLRHAKADHPNAADDHERPLAARGKEDAKLMGQYLVENQYIPGYVLCSTAKRTQQTLQIVSRAFSQEIPTHYLKQLYLATPGEMLKEISTLDDNIASIMLVGHNPGIHQLSILLTGSTVNEKYYADMRVKFPTCALAIFTTTITSWKELEPGFCTLKGFVVHGKE